MQNPEVVNVANLEQQRGGDGAARSFSADPEHSYTLPAHYYYSPELYAKEREAIFFRNWQYVGHADQLKNPGDYVVGNVLDQRILVTRTESGALKAFYNICSHRGHLLAKENGHARRIVCPFHAWAFNLDGQLCTAPNAKNVSCFSFEEHSLVEVRVEQFLNLVMVNLDPKAVPLAEMVDGMAQEILQYIPDVANFKFARTDAFPLKCNWKFVFDQLECYHCPVLHPAAARSVDLSRRKTTEHNWWNASTSFTAPREDRDSLLLRSGEGDAFRNNHVWCFWPNYMLLGQPGPANFVLVEAIPRGPEEVTVQVHHFFPTETPSEESVRQMNALRDVVFPEDTSAIESQQNGVKCLGYRGGRLMVDKDRSYLSEHLTHWFDKKVWDLHQNGLPAHPTSR